MSAFKFHPDCETFPRMEAKEFSEFMADIKAGGQRDPVIIDQDDVVIDGRSRVLACEALGIEPKTKKLNFADDAARAEYIRSANIHRRNLTASQRARHLAKLNQAVKLGRPQKGPDERMGNVSWRNINPQLQPGARHKVPNSRISKARAVYNFGDEKLIEEMRSDEKSIEAAYREVKAKRPKPKKEPDEPPSLFEAAREEWKSLAKLREVIAKAGKEILANIREPIGAFVAESAVEADLSNLLRHIDAGRPYAKCPYCGGDKCKACKQQGWMPKLQYEASPRELKGEK